MMKKCASINILDFFVQLLFPGINLLCNTMIQSLFYFILCTICNVILLAAICKCSSLLREEIFESVQPITTCAANRLNLTCPKDICNEQVASESRDGTTDDCCVCYAKPPWEISGGRAPSLLMIEYRRRDGIATL